MISPADKPALRSRMLGLRREAARQWPAAGEHLARNFPDDWLPAAGTPVAGYWPLDGEIDPRPLMRRLAARGHPLCLPVVQGQGRPLVFRAWTDGDALLPGGLGVMEPLADRSPLKPGLVLVPLLACDGSGNRLGFGKGYYDFTLAGLRAAGPVRAIGLSFESQLLAVIPAQAHDQPLDGLVTESRALDFRLS
ncbi:5-formyltetrahydrofolate cyclo-ligase [Maricaulis sp.]|uniref:5-formyltetrahydrofolate cyclo-ligase n=1 Tax=Maricaulis sp. TaxID=1486257 RepID=UPI002B2705E8|nr:5-formyltetrahydrofolate cyclo-ligase [Maricaulis sp.]